MKWVLLGGLALWVWLLRGFVSARSLVVLSLFGPVLLVAGLSLARAMGRHLLQPGWYAGGFGVGLVLIAGAAATLLPAAPANLLTTTGAGWEILDQRIFRLTAAMNAGDAGTTRRLAGRGLGDREPLDLSGRPVMHGATAADVLAGLVDAGLDPDVRDDDGRTPLMRARQPEAVRLLLAAGADVDARDREGFTAADLLPDDLVAQVEAHAGRRIARRTAEQAEPRGRSDWLTVTGSAAAPSAESAITVEPQQVRRGDTATVTATLVNASGEDRWLDVTATLNGAALLVAASHDGAVDRPGRPLVTQTIRWPTLAQPAHSQGRITLQIVTREDREAGDLRIDWRVQQRPTRDTDLLQLSQPFEDPAVEPAARAMGWVAATFVAITAALWLAVGRWRRRSGPAGQGGDVTAVASVVAAGVALVCGLVVLVMLWSSAEPYVRFEPAECTILDQRVRTYTYTTGASTRLQPSSQTETRTGSAPLVAVRIAGGGASVVTTGFDVSFTSRSVQAVRRFPIGARVPCWVDPARATRFTLERRPPVSSGLALGTLTIFGLLLMAIARGIRPDSASAPRTPRRRARGRKAP